MSEKNFFELSADFQQSIDDLNQVLKGDDATTVLIDGVFKPSISKALNDKWNAIHYGIVTFTTYAELTGYSPLDTEIKGSFKVTNDDVSSDNNGYYSWVSGTSYAKDADLVVNAIDTYNMSDAVSGAAVSSFTLNAIISAGAKYTKFNTVGLWFSSGVFSDSVNWRSQIIPVESGTIIGYTLYSIAPANIVTYLNESLEVIGNIPATNNTGVSQHTSVLQVPYGCSYIALSTSIGRLEDSSYKKLHDAIEKSTLFNKSDNIKYLTGESMYDYLQTEEFQTDISGMTRYKYFYEIGAYFSDGSYNKSINWRTQIIDAREGSNLRYYLNSISGVNLITFLDAEKLVIGKIPASVSGLGIHVGKTTAPAGTYFVAISTHITDIDNSYYITNAPVTLSKSLAFEKTDNIKYLTAKNVYNYFFTEEFQTNFMGATKYNDFNEIGGHFSDGSYNKSINWKTQTISAREHTIVYYNLNSIVNANRITFLDANKSIISFIAASNSQLQFVSGYAVAPANTAFIAMTTHKTDIENSYYIANTVELDNASVINDLATKIARVLPPVKNITVSKTQTMDSENYIFNTITAALGVAVIGDTIYVHDGVYLEKGLKLPHGISIVGIGLVEIRGENPASATSAQIDNTSTIDMFDSGRLENIKVTAKNMRYPIHADFSIGNTIKNVSNCEFIHYGNQEAWQYRTDNSIPAPNSAAETFRACSAWGGGTRSGDKVYAKGCKFISQMRGFSTHNNVDFNLLNGASIVELTNCELISKGIDFDGSNIGFTVPLFIQHLISNSSDLLTLTNCTVNGFIVNYGGATIKVVHDTEGLRQVWHSAGSAKAMTDQIATLVENLDYYDVNQKEIKNFKNLGPAVIPRGHAVKKAQYGVALMTNSDIPSDFFGVAMQEIAKNDTGNVKFSGYLIRSYLSGLSPVTVDDGDSIGITSTGSFVKNSGVIVCHAADNQNILIN